MIGTTGSTMTDPRRATSPLGFAGFRARLAEEVERVRRSGGFLSVAALGGSTGNAEAMSQRLPLLGASLREGIRAQDVLGADEETVFVLMPDTDSRQARAAGERLLGKACDVADVVLLASVGVATTYGDVEGGADALLQGAEAAQQASAAGSIGTSEALRGHPRVLVIDDDVAFASALSDTVSDMGWEGHPCSEIADILSRVKDRAYSALFVDLVIPGFSGVEVLRQSMAAFPHRPAVLMTGFEARHEDVVAALCLGPVMFVQKPLSRKDLDIALQMFRALLPGVSRR